MQCYLGPEVSRIIWAAGVAEKPPGLHLQCLVDPVVLEIKEGTGKANI